MVNIRPRVIILVALVPAIAACSSSRVQPPSAAADSTPELASDATPTPAASLEAVPGEFDISRVGLMDPADLPQGVPVPVPAGGQVDDSMGVFEGELLAVEYDPRFFATAAAFYDTWFQLEGLEASPLLVMGDDAAGWEVDIDGAPVQVQLSVTDSLTLLEVYWD